MKNSLFLLTVLLVGFVWAGSPEDSVFVLDCREPQSDSVFIWKCDSVFVEDSIAAAQNQYEPSSEGEPSPAYAGNDAAYAQSHTVVREPKVSGWTIFFWGMLEAIANSDNGDDCKPARAAKRERTLFVEDTQRPARERGTRRR